MKPVSKQSPYAQIIAPRPVRGLFTYSVPPDLNAEAEPGRRVLIPFGPRKLVGLIASRTDRADVKTKPLLQIIDHEPVVSANLLELALWTADYYLAAPGEVASLVLPRDDAVVETVVELTRSTPPETSSKMAKLLFKTLEEKGGSRKLALLAADLKMPVAKIKKILAGQVVRGFIRQRESVRFKKRRTPKKRIAKAKGDSSGPIELTGEQEKAVKIVTPDINAGRFKVHLLHGVTGSGKTEIYIRLAIASINAGKSVLALAPEIALSNMIARSFEERLNTPVTVLHSGLTPAERFERWRQVKSGEAKVVVGARSAVFAPLVNLGLIIVDEEHDPTYKQEESPRYHGRDVAVKRGSLENIPVVLGSATPSMESYNNAMNEKYGLIELNSRVDARPMPRVEIVEPDGQGDIGIRLKEEIKSCLKLKGQALLFLNKRGAARFIQCSKCGHVFSCRNCSLSLVYHSDSKKLNCHTCGYSERAPDVCAKCNYDELYEGGSGTQKVEREISEMFKTARVARMDRDTTSRRDSSSKILSAVESRSIDILVGTQMITKGHDFPGINVVGVVSADDLLYMPDFRSAERTFQQIAQAAGRAGRGDREGKVIVQTLSGAHHSVKSAARHDYRQFYQKEAPLREAAGYPPFTRLAKVRIESASVAKGNDYLERIEPVIKKVGGSVPGLALLGPVEAVVFKVRNRYRWRILFKASTYKTLRKGLKMFIEMAESGVGSSKDGVKITVDVDPVDVM